MERVKLLLVDAEEDFSQRFVRDLGGVNFDVAWEPSAAQGEQSARTWKPDLVVIDVNLPDSNGFKLFTRLNRLGDLSGTRFVITGADVPEKTFADHQKLKRRADLYIHKPYRPDELRARIVHELGIRSAAPAQAAPVAPATRGIIDDPGRTQQRRSVREEDYLDELDDLLADVDVSSLHSAARDDDADLNELDRLLGGPSPAEVATPPEIPQPPALPDLPDIPALSAAPVLAEVPQPAEVVEPPRGAALPPAPVAAAPQPLAEDDLDSLFPQEDTTGLDDLLDAEEAPPEPLQAGMHRDEPSPVEPEVARPLPVLEELTEEEDADDDPIAQVRESELAALIDKLESARAQRDEALREVEQLRQAALTLPAAGAAEGGAESDELRNRLRKAQDVARLKSQEATELSARQEQLVHALKDANEEIERLRAKLKTHGEEVAGQYRDTLTRMKDTVGDLKDALTEAQDALSEREKALLASQEQEAGLRAANETLSRELAGLKNALEQEKARATEELARERDRAAELLEREQTQAAERLERERAQAAERLERETGLLVARLDELGGGQQEADEQVRLLQSRIADLEQLVSDQAMQYETRLMEREDAEKATLQKIETTHEQQLAALTLQLEAARERGEALETERTKLLEEMDGLRDRLAERSGEIKSLGARLEELSAVLDERERRLEDASGENEQRIAALNAELLRLREANARNEKRVIDAFTRLKADMEARARVEKALMLALKLVKSPGASGKVSQVRPEQGG